MALPPGVTVTVGPAEEPMPALNKYVFHFADPATEPVALRFRYAGPINTEHESGNKPLRPAGSELFIDHMWYPVGADIQKRFTVDATIDGPTPELVAVAHGDVTWEAGGVAYGRGFLGE